MDSRGVTLGGSLLVPSVQELAKQAITTVPTRYIRPGRVDSVASDVVQGYEVPVIDMQRLLEDGDSVDSDELAKLHSACKDWGFFQLVNHGVSSSLLNKVRREIEELFNLPMEEKKKLWQTPKDLEGFGQAFVVSDEQKLDWADLFFITTLPISMRKPQLFEKLPVSFRDTLESYSKELKHVFMTIVAQFSKALKIEAKEMRELFEDGLQVIRTNYYPPCPEPEKVIGLSPHSDAAALTILLQVSEVEGLQIKKDGKWVPIMPLPNAFVVNIGDVLELVNHGVRSSLVDEVKREITNLFNLPMEEKKKLWQTPGEIEGFGQAFVVSDEQKLDWGDMFCITALPVSLRKPQLFPKLPLPFRETLDSYSNEVKILAKNIIANFSKALKIEGDEMKELFEDGMLVMRMNYYPPCPEPDKVIGLNPHSDGAALTILLQVNEVEGLQVKKDGKWVPITPLPNAFIVNIGDILEIVTNGVYRSIEHRATVNAEKERISIASFYDAHNEVEFGPASSLITPKSPFMFRRMTVQEFKKGFFSRELDGKSYLDVIRLKLTKV